MTEFTLSEAPLTEVEAVSGTPGSARPAWAGRPGRLGPRPTLPRRLVRGIDAALRRLYRIREFSEDPDCLLRIAVVRTRHDFILGGDERVPRGAEIIELHLWNERVAAVSTLGAGLGRTNNLRRRFAVSCSELARHLDSEPALAGVAAVRASANLASRERTPKLLRIAAAFGFEPVRGGPARGRGRWSEFAENVFTCVLAWAFNPAALRGDMLRRTHCDLWVSREAFIARHGRMPQHEADASPRGEVSQPKQ